MANGGSKSDSTRYQKSIWAVRGYSRTRIIVDLDDAITLPSLIPHVATGVYSPLFLIIVV